jgi:hypothetical protein
MRLPYGPSIRIDVTRSRGCFAVECSAGGAEDGNGNDEAGDVRIFNPHRSDEQPETSDSLSPS